MATSGTTTFSLRLADVLDEAFERAKIDPESISSRHIDSGTRSYNLAMIKIENMGHQLFHADHFSQTLTASIPGYRLPVGTHDVLSGVIRDTDGLDYPQTPISRTEYLRLAKKRTESSRPYNFWVSFDVEDTNFLQSTLTDPTTFDSAYDPTAAANQPILVMYPVPDTAYTFVGYRLRFTQDGGNLDNHIDARRLWWDAVCAEVAHRLASKYSPPELAASLKGEATEALVLAKQESRSRRPLVIATNARSNRRRRR